MFHGCACINSDRTVKLIAKGHDCFIRTNKCFWKNASDVAVRIKTRSMTKNEGVASLKTFNDYFKDKEEDNDII